MHLWGNLLKQKWLKIKVFGGGGHNEFIPNIATRGLESGVELKVMQEFLGHASIKMTADTYTHVLPNKKKDSILKLENIIKI